MLTDLANATTKVGLQINTQKTKIMTNLVLGETLTLGRHNIDEVREYRYLGHDIKIHRDDQTQKLQRRVGLGWAAYGKLNGVFKSDIPICLKRV